MQDGVWSRGVFVPLVCIGWFAEPASRKKTLARGFSSREADIGVIVGNVKTEVVLAYGVFRVGLIHSMSRFDQHLVGRLGGPKPFPHEHLYGNVYGILDGPSGVFCRNGLVYFRPKPDLLDNFGVFRIEASRFPRHLLQLGALPCHNVQVARPWLLPATEKWAKLGQQILRAYP